MTDDDETVILVCGLVKGPLMIADNLTGRCDMCDRLVEFRPHAPRPHILRCLGCAIDLMEPDDVIEVPPRMMEDALFYFRKRRH